MEFTESAKCNSSDYEENLASSSSPEMKSSLANLRLSESRNSESDEATRQKIDPNALTRSHFYFGKTLGEGSYARVVHAIMKTENSPQFAIKIMEKAHIIKEKKVKYVMMEKNILSSISHPFIIKLYYTFKDSEYLYMCMDLACGGELLHLINRHHKENLSKGIIDVACPKTVTQFYIAEIIQAVSYLHDNDIIHMDLKPENILLTSTGHIKIADFGTALKGLDQEALADIFVGTAEYVSPEVLNEDGEISKACDLWAIGCILFQMCVGRPPFHAETEYLIFQNINSHADGSCPLVYPSTVSESEKSLMEGLLVCNSCMRLGAGTCEEQRDMHGLKQHSFFDGVDWENLHVMTAPFQPDPATFPSRDNMRDGNMEEWLLDDDDVSPLLPIITHNDINVTRSSSADSGVKSGKPRRKTSLHGAGGVDGYYLATQKWQKFMLEGESQLFAGLVSKRVGLFSKRRQLILTDLPRLIYIDPDSMELKGEVPWTNEKPVVCTPLSQTAFDVLATSTRRVYHFTDCEGAGSQMWADLIAAMVEKRASMNSIILSNRVINNLDEDS